MTMRLAHWLMIFSVLVMTTAVSRGCGDDDSITDCSKRNKPMRWDRQKDKWTCED